MPDKASRGERIMLRRKDNCSDERSAVGICTKYWLFFNNFIFLIAGLGMTILGAYILIIKEKRVYDVVDFFLDPACDMCLAGSIFTVISFIGAVGALRENTCFLKLYLVILSIALLAQLTFAVLMFVSYSVPEAKNVVFPKDLFKQAIVHYRDDPDMQHLIDTLQEELGCCGLSDDNEGFKEWNNNIYFNCSNDDNPEKCSVPYSCCKRKPGDKINYRCGADVLQIASDNTVEANSKNIDLIYSDGCIKAMGDWINDHVLIVGGVMIGILVPQVVNAILARNLVEMIAIQKSKW